MRRRRAAFAMLAVAMVASGCGARWSGKERATVFAHYRGAAAPAAGDATTGTSVVAADAGPAAPGTGAATSNAGATPGAATGGGAAANPSTAASATAPCAAASTAPGVSKDTITVANISTVSGPVPGLGATAVAAVRAYGAYRNATGGVCGRKIDVKTADDGNDSGRFRTLVTDFAPRVLGLVGNFAGGDGGGVETVESQKIPSVVEAFTDAFQNASVVFDLNPPPPNTKAVIGKYKYLIAQGVKKVALVTLAVAQSESQLDLQQSLMQAAGIQVVSKQLLPLSTLNFDSAARTVANSGADYLFFLAAAQHDAGMAQSMRKTGYKLKFEEYLTGYGSNYTDLAGSAAEGTSSWIRSLPNEEAGSNAEQTAFLHWMDQTAPDAQTDTFAADAWAGAKAFFDALQQLPGPISRDALIAKLRATTNFDAGGFFGPINLGHKLSNNCYLGMKVVNGKWTRIAPDHGYLCQ